MREAPPPCPAAPPPPTSPRARRPPAQRTSPYASPPPENASPALYQHAPNRWPSCPWLPPRDGINRKVGSPEKPGEGSGGDREPANQPRSCVPPEAQKARASPSPAAEARASPSSPPPK